MTSAVSSERVDWIITRIKVLSAMHLELMTRPAKYNASTVQEAPVLHAALSAIRAEKLQLLVELEVLTQHLKQNEAK